jgi:hypothetical protein
VPGGGDGGFGKHLLHELSRCATLLVAPISARAVLDKELHCRRHCCVFCVSFFAVGGACSNFVVSRKIYELKK